MPETITLMPSFYFPPLNTPLYWQNEQTGLLPDAVWAYYNSNPAPSSSNTPMTPDQTALVCEYLRYYINAPCWYDNAAGDDEYRAEIQDLRDKAKALSTKNDIDQFIDDCLELGLDPL